MLLEKTTDPRWLSNSWLLADSPGGTAVLVDAGAPMEPLLEVLRAQELELSHVLLTHHHGDHCLHAERWRESTGALVCAHPAEAELFDFPLDLLLEGSETLETGGLELRALHVPGHTRGQLSFLANGAMLFTGDTLFRRSVGGTRGPGHGTFAQLRSSILDVLLAFPAATEVLPGHVERTSVGQELEHNPFVRAWTGRDPVTERPCTAFERPATLLLSAPDYDGGTKCWVRWPDGSEDVVPGSRVQAA